MPISGLLMKEYRDGILLFELTDQKVWGKAVRDTAGLDAYYAAHKSDFMWDTRYDAIVYTCSDAAVAKQVRGLTWPKRSKRGRTILDHAVNKDNALGPYHRKWACSRWTRSPSCSGARQTRA
jgi:hypothetical protein